MSIQAFLRLLPVAGIAMSIGFVLTPSTSAASATPMVETPTESEFFDDDHVVIHKDLCRLCHITTHGGEFSAPLAETFPSRAIIPDLQSN